MKSALSFSLSSLLFTSCLFLLPVALEAQGIDQPQAIERMDRLERDIMLMQRQMSRGGNTSAAVSDDLPVSGGGQLEIRLSAIEEQLREIRGRSEENENRTRKLTETLDKLQRDIDMRFSDLSSAPAMNQMTNVRPDPQPTEALVAAPFEKANATVEARKPDTTVAAPAEDAQLQPQPDFTTPREHYNYAFRLLNQTLYTESAASFEGFTKKYPKDPLVGNAYYWQGETYYIRRDYIKAADNFRKGFESMPEGPKAADNLLKLAMSLSALKRDKEACLVLQQVTTKFKSNSSSVVDKAEQEQKRIACSKA